MADQDIRKCLVDEEGYNKNKKKVIEQIRSGNRVYSCALVDTVKTVLKDKSEGDITKFISLYFLKQAMDTKDDDLVSYVKDTLLKHLSEIAKGEVPKVINKTTEKRLVKNFDKLLLECFHFWNDWFGMNKNGKPTKYRTYFEEVSKKVKMPKEYNFFVAKMPKTQVPDKPQKKDEPRSTGMGNTPGGYDLVEKLQMSLQILDGNKELLLNTLINEEKPEEGVLSMISEQLKETNKEITNNLVALLTMDFPNKENTLNKVTEESHFTSLFLNKYSKYQKKQISLDKFKAAIINAIVSSKEEE